MADELTSNGSASGDDDLLGRLGAAFAVAPVEPPDEGLATLRRAVAERQVAGESGRRAPARRPWWRQPLPVAGLAFGLVLGGTGTALAAGAPLPRPLRSLAHDIGLPVDSPQLDDVRKANEKLRDDLRTTTTSPSTAHDAAELSRKLAGLDDGERAKVASEADVLLGEVHGRSGQSGQSGQSGSNGGGTSSSGSGGSGGSSGDDGGSRSGSTSNAGGSGTSGGTGTSGGSGEGTSGSGSGRHGDDGGQPSATSTPNASTTSTTPTSTDDGRGGGGGGGDDSGGRGGGGAGDGSGSGKG